MPNFEKGRKNAPEACMWPIEKDLNYKDQLPEIVDRIVASCHEAKDIQHLDATALPSREGTLALLSDIESVLFPGYVGRNEVESSNLIYYIGEKINKIYDELSEQIMRAIRHDCFRQDDGECRHCYNEGKKHTLTFLNKIPQIRKKLEGDINAAFRGDPAAEGLDEIIFAYPGIKAVTIYRIAHQLWSQRVPILPRIMTEHAHTATGVDIHAGATIGENFFIDHGTGVVIGETTKIGNNVQLYQGVTLGALRLPRNPEGHLERHAKRHPTIEDNVTIYSGTTILGGETIIGEGSVIGGNIWLTHSIPPGSKVLMSPPKIEVLKQNGKPR